MPVRLAPRDRRSVSPARASSGRRWRKAGRLAYPHLPMHKVICAIAGDDEELACDLAANARAHADAVIVGDASARDGTSRRLREGGATVVDVPQAGLLRDGFAFARNAVLACVPREAQFVHFRDLDGESRSEGPAWCRRRSATGS